MPKQEAANNNSYELSILEAIYKILKVEAPVHIDEFMNRIMFGFKDLYHTNRHRTYCLQAIESEIKKGNIIRTNHFLYLPNTQILVRNRGDIFEKFDMSKIPVEEIRLAAYQIIKNEFGIEEGELAKIIAKYLGASRVTQHLQSNIISRIKSIRNDEHIKFQDNRYYYTDEKNKLYSPVKDEGIKVNEYKPLEKEEYQISLRRAYFSTKEKRYIMQTDQLKELIYKVLSVEAPIHIEDCFDRIAKYLSIKSAKDYYWNYKRYLDEEISKGKIIKKKDFLYLPSTRVVVRDRNHNLYDFYCGKIQVWKIPPEEIHIIAFNLIENNQNISEDDLVKFISKELGFGRMTKYIQDAIIEVIEPLKNNEHIKYNEGQYSFVR